MDFIFTAEEIQPIAKKIIDIYKQEHYKIEIEKSLLDAPSRTTLIVKQNTECLLIEIQSKLYYSKTLKELAHWIARDRKNCELYIALDSNAQTSTANQLTEIKKDGIGLMVLNANGAIDKIQRAKNFSMIINPDPTLKFGAYASDIREAIHKFNETNRQDGLRDLCEVFEKAVEDLGIKACKKKKFSSLDEKGFLHKDLSSRIDILGSNDAFIATPLIDDTLKTDLHSFRNARNLIDHPPRTKKEKQRRERQYADKMMMGPRIISELEKIKHKIK